MPVIFRKVQCKSDLSMRGVKSMCIYEGVQLKSKLQHVETWSATAWPLHHLCYCPAVFFFHLVSLGIRSCQEKFGMCLKNDSIAILPLKTAWLQSVQVWEREIEGGEVCMYVCTYVLCMCLHTCVLLKEDFLCLSSCSFTVCRKVLKELLPVCEALLLYLASYKALVVLSHYRHSRLKSLCICHGFFSHMMLIQSSVKICQLIPKCTDRNTVLL
jgi:hypothetical protein